APQQGFDRMNNKIKNSIFGLLGAIIVGWTMYGTKSIEALHAAWLFLLGMSKEAPLGLSSFALSVAISVLAQLFMRRHFTPDNMPAATRSTVIDSAGVLIGLVVMYLQLSTTKGMLLGIMAGFVSPWVSRIVAALCGYISRALQNAMDAGDMNDGGAK